MAAGCVTEAFIVPPVQYIEIVLGAGGYPAVTAQWQSPGGSSQRCLGFDSQQDALSIYITPGSSQRCLGFDSQQDALSIYITPGKML